MKSKEQLINEIEEKNRILYKMASVSDLEGILKDLEKALKTVKYFKELLEKIDIDEVE